MQYKCIFDGEVIMRSRPISYGVRRHDPTSTMHHNGLDVISRICLRLYEPIRTCLVLSGHIFVTERPLRTPQTGSHWLLQELSKGIVSDISTTELKELTGYLLIRVLVYTEYLLIRSTCLLVYLFTPYTEYLLIEC